MPTAPNRVESRQRRGHAMVDGTPVAATDEVGARVTQAQGMSVVNRHSRPLSGAAIESRAPSHAHGDEGAHTAMCRPWGAYKGPKVEDGPVAFSRSFRAADHAKGKFLKPVVIAVVGLPWSAEATANDTDEVRIHHRQRGIHGGDCDRSADILANVWRRFAKRRSSQNLMSQSLETDPSSSLEAEGRDERRKLVHRGFVDGFPIGKSCEKRLNDLAHRRRGCSLEKNFGDRDSERISPDAPRKGPAGETKPGCQIATDNRRLSDLFFACSAVAIARSNEGARV
jgi:hypothetical protein